MGMAKAGAISQSKIKEEVTEKTDLVLEGEVTALSIGAGSAPKTRRFYGRLAAPPPAGDPAYIQDFEGATGSLPSGWTSSGDGGWSMQVTGGTGPHGGAQCCISDVITHAQTASLNFTSPLAVEGDCSFWWDVGSEDGFDHLRFFVDGVLQDTITGAPGWTQVSLTIPATASLMWSFSKDGSLTSPPDRGKIDDFQLLQADYAGGDTYFDTGINKTMEFDSTRAKWLSQETYIMHFGNSPLDAWGTAGNRAFSGSAGGPYSNLDGLIAPHSGTIVSMNFCRGVSDTTIFAVRDQLATVSAYEATDIREYTITLDDDFDQDAILNIYNAGPGESPNTMGSVGIKWRSSGE